MHLNQMLIPHNKNMLLLFKKIYNKSVYAFVGIYLGLGDHYDHTYRGWDGVDLHDDIGTTLTPVFTENGTYSTHLFAERAVDIINNHNVDEVYT